MFKRNPYLLLLNFILFVITILFGNIYIKLIIYLVMFYLKISKKAKLDIFSLLTLLIILINIVYMKFYFIGNIFLVLYYLLLMSDYLDKKVIINYYNYLFIPNKKRDNIFIKLLYFKKVFLNKLAVNNNIFTKGGYKKDIKYYYYLLELSYNDTLESLEDKIILYKSKSFFNKGRNRVIIRIDYKDILLTILYFMVMVISIKWRI